MTLQIPLTFSAAQLKRIALKCGISSSGTKAVLAARISHELLKTEEQRQSDRPRLKGNPLRVLSIDMGIRNLAYCVLDIPRRRRETSAKYPILNEWHRVAVSTPPPTEAEPLGEDDLPESAERIVTKEAEKESFTPDTLSLAAYKLLRHRLLFLKPSYILIERQRFRSMGHGSVLEWTIRVNMLEAILHGVLCTLKEEGLWTGSVISVTPGRSGAYYQGESAEGDESVAPRKERTTKTAKLLNKGFKIDLVKSWLGEKRNITLGGKQAETVAKAFLDKWNRSPGRGTVIRIGEGEKMGKLDDLADCLVQGMAWIEWEKNKRTALKHGVEALLAPPSGAILVRDRTEKSSVRLRAVTIP
ncbi:hypothetical protein HYALB_00006005 [Hymenoscyphus albidus]|uniref:Mitochondrial resolvase Ydc2 catalytic domain-containing protein n=1 Tax=Hymenoscyphus albidus TaxID=595503 RepID=A0A9N9LLS1_9HELO|nr:hypothetical protein HYALB_00006005 [Hymenoscyphus albidus]